ncbi:MAG: hypothetical protein ACOC46_02665 [Pirellulales bacterium]
MIHDDFLHRSVTATRPTAAARARRRANCRAVHIGVNGRFRSPRVASLLARALLVLSAALFSPAFIVGSEPDAGAAGDSARSTGPLRIQWDDDLLVVRSPVLPDGKLEIWYLEAFCRSGSTRRDWRETVLPHETVKLAADPAGRSLRLRSVVEGGVVVLHEIRAGQDDVDFRLALTNPTGQPVDVQWAQPCIRVGAFTGLGQQEYIRRSFIFTEAGLTTLDRTRRAEEALYRGGQVYVPAGIDQRDVNPRPISPDVPAEGLIGCFSADGRSLLATAWDQTQELFQGVIVCLHSDFRIGGLKAGETKTLHGKLYILPNDVPALLRRYRADFPAARRSQQTGEPATGSARERSPAP